MLTRTRNQKISFTIIVLGVLSLLFDNSNVAGPLYKIISHGIDTFITILFVSQILYGLIRSKRKMKFLKRNLLDVVFVGLFLVVFIGVKYYHFFVSPIAAHDLPVEMVVLVSIFNIFHVLLRIKKLNYFFKNLTKHPAQTIMLSFFGVILGGTILLMMEFATTAAAGRLGFINALFTATSATCVTGLIVVDTAKEFSVFGKLIIMALMQIGGLGIMILAYFAAYLLGKKLTYEDRAAISYMLNDDDATSLREGVRNIVLITIMFEAVGAWFLYLGFAGTEGLGIKNIFYSTFHAVSAFCNAGFSLFPDNLMRFASNPVVSIVVAVLIIAGGLSFIVLSNSYYCAKSVYRRKLRGCPERRVKLSVNSKIVLAVTGALLIGGTLLIYQFEHRPYLIEYGLGQQYLMSFFQCVTLRTAGFNTMDMTALRSVTYVIMILFMFIGGAAGSCAGGIKVNTVGVVWAYVRSIFNNKEDVVLLDHTVPKDLINHAFFVMFLALSAIFVGSMVLMITEKEKFLKILFEATSAFGTVGLSAGITQGLSGTGRLVLIALMFIGRLGPLTVITALSQKTKKYQVKYPVGKISIG